MHSPLQVRSKEACDDWCGEVGKKASLRSNHALESASQRDGAGGDDLGVGHSRHRHDTHWTDKIRVKDPGRRVLGGGLSIEAEDLIRSVQGVAWRLDVDGVLIIAAVECLQWVAREDVLDDSGGTLHGAVDDVSDLRFWLGFTLLGIGRGASIRSIQFSDGADDRCTATVSGGELWVGVFEGSGPVADEVRRPEVSAGVTVEWSQVRVGVLS